VINNGSGRSLIERALGAVVLFLVAAMVLRSAVDIILSILWPLIAIVGAVIAGAALWQFWRYRRGGW